VRIAAVDDDIARLEMRNDGIDKSIDRWAGFDQQEHFAGTLQVGDQFLDAVAADDGFALGPSVHEGVDFVSGAVEYGDPVTVARHVQNQVFAHDSKANQGNITIRFCRVHHRSSQFRLPAAHQSINRA
jgi:hypothetical protein